MRNGTISPVYIPTAYRLTHTVDGIHGNDPHHSIFIHRCLNTPLRSSTPPITCPPRLVPKVASTSTTRFLEKYRTYLAGWPRRRTVRGTALNANERGLCRVASSDCATTANNNPFIQPSSDRAGMLPGGIWVPHHTLSGWPSPVARNMIAGRGRRQKWSFCLEYLGQRCRLNDSSKSSS